MKTSVKKAQIEFDIITKYFQNSNVHDLLFLYVEAKTGEEKNVDKLTCFLGAELAMKNLQKEINEFNVDKLLSDVFKGQPTHLTTPPKTNESNT